MPRLVVRFGFRFAGLVDDFHLHLCSTVRYVLVESVQTSLTREDEGHGLQEVILVISVERTVVLVAVVLGESTE